MTDLDGTVTQHDGNFLEADGFPFFDGNVLAVDGKSNFDGMFTAVTQHDGTFLAVDGFSFFYGKFLVVDGNQILTVFSRRERNMTVSYRRQTVFVFLAPQVSGLMPNTYLVHERNLKRGSPRLDHKSYSPVRRQQLFVLW